MSKECKKCGRVLGLSEFYKITTTGQIMTDCKRCHNLNCIARRAENPEKYSAYHREWKRSHLERSRELNREAGQRFNGSVKAWMWQLKQSQGCVVCGFNHPAALQFHHTDVKQYEISKMVREGYSMDKIQKEIENCILLCANCHALEHYFTGYVSISSQSVDDERQLSLPLPSYGVG
jgi:hypothetical protein